MPNESVQNLMASVLGRLSANTAQEKDQMKTLGDLLSRTSLPEELAALKASNFSFEDADLFSAETLTRSAAAAFQQVGSKLEEAAEYKVFVRETPVRSTQIFASNPSWASGAAPEKTIGPLTSADGRLLWFDFFKIEKLVALYVQGNPNPAILFKITTGFHFININYPLAAAAADSYKLNAGSVWINSQLLAQNAPAGYFTGLTISGGTVSLTAKATLINNKLTIPATATATVRLSLKQQKVTDADPNSDYGKDARAAELQLPDELAFHFKGNTSTIDHAGGASWQVYGNENSFQHNAQIAGNYDTVVNRVLIPYTASNENFEATNSQSPFHTLAGQAHICDSFWALPAASIDVANPSAAEGTGAMLIQTEGGLAANWSGLKGGALGLNQPYIMASPGRIAITDLAAGNVFSYQNLNLWKDHQNPFGTTARLQFSSGSPFYFNTLANGTELIMALTNADVRADRPVKVNSEPLEIRSKNSVLLLAVTHAFRLIYLFDDNIIFDNLDQTVDPVQPPKAISLALRNALFKTTPVNGCLLFGLLAEDFEKVETGALYLTMGLYAYLPTLPDPYAANINRLKYQFRGTQVNFGAVSINQPTIWAWLVCQVKWQPVGDESPFRGQGVDEVEVSFHFAPLQAQAQSTAAPVNQNLDFTGLLGNDPKAGVDPQSYQDRAETVNFARSSAIPPLPDYGEIWDGNTNRLTDDTFALLDVSTNADLLGISFGLFGNTRLAMVTTMAPVGSAGLPLQVEGMDVVSRGFHVKAFTVPQISWEPVINLTPPDLPNGGDPDFGFNYYPDDGGATRILNNSAENVVLAPIPLTDFLVENFAEKENFSALSLFTLPFGMRALALLQKEYLYEGNPRPGADLTFNSKSFKNNITGARQLEVDGGDALRQGESDMFMGSTVQINNILDVWGNETGDSTLGGSVTKIYNNEWLMDPFQLIRQRGVPLERIDLSGYGASIFSNWLNPKAAIAETSQAKFDVFVGRTAHEIIQVKSIMYPWAVKVVRTITLFRVSTGYVYRHDSGWKAESDGRFDFTYYVYKDDPANPGKLIPDERQGKYEIHPGVSKGLFLIKNIHETEDIQPIKGTMQIAPGEEYVDINGKALLNMSGSNIPFDYELQPVFFDADVEIENPVSGFATKKIGNQDKQLVSSKKILGFVQIQPRGLPITTQAFKDMIIRQAGSIGGAIDCVVDIGSSGQQMRINRFDISNSFGQNGTDPIFAVAGRGSVLLPKDGAWSMVKHNFGSGEVNPVPPDLSVPIVRIGKLIKQGGNLVLDKNPANELLRIANPTELLRSAVNDTINYGFLQSTDTQKALFLTPSFKQGLDKMLSKTPPLFADGFRICNSKAIFPNIGNASGNFGDAISLVKSGTEFVKNAATDGGTQVLELMKINDTVAAVKQEGYKLLKQIENFDLPNTEWELINLGGGTLRIYIEYKADKIQKQGGGTKNAKGALDFDVDSFANNLADQWKSKMGNVGVVIDLGPIKRLMTIKGNWDSQKGVAAQYGGKSSDPDFPSPQIEFAKELEPIIEILQILQDLQGENYAGAMAKGLKLAMSNKAGSWEYKLEASKEIPVIRFPMPDAIYNDPNTPLKLEAGLKLGAYFNAALKVTTNPGELLPTAGAFVGFYGRLSVMCVSISAATVYAIGQVNLDIAADTKVGPSLKMKFGFGAQIVVGLPVVGNVSVLFMTSVEIYTDATSIIVTAGLLFQGHAELLAGLVSVTITIEAKGTIARIGNRTDMAAQVTFGLDISIFLVINISFSTSWSEERQIA
ncbi:MAG: hypothetical protein H6577_01345 [Lewinellaceae bacterium]|nr:hypothetical protein [Lewinellaceae bacterium]